MDSVQQYFTIKQGHAIETWHSDVRFLPRTAGTYFFYHAHVAFTNMQNVYMIPNSKIHHVSILVLVCWQIICWMKGNQSSIWSPILCTNVSSLHQVIDCIMQHFTYVWMFGDGSSHPNHNLYRDQPETFLLVKKSHTKCFACFSPYFEQVSSSVSWLPFPCTPL